MPQTVNIYNLNRKTLTPANVKYCASFLCKLRGLMFRSRLQADEGLFLVERKNSRLDPSIHMFFVPFDLAVFWINSELIVVDKVIAKSWHPAYIPRVEAQYTLEIHKDRIGEFEIGDKVEFRNV